MARIQRVATFDSGHTEWLLRAINRGVEVGRFAITTPRGNPGIIIHTGESGEENRFNMQNKGQSFSFGFDDDGSAGDTLEIQKGGSVFIRDLPDASSAPGGANLESVVVDRATGKLYAL